MANQRWTIDKFLPAYLEAAEKGMTREAFAESIGLKSETVYQRVYNLRKTRRDIPLLRSAGKVPMLERADEIMEAYNRRRKSAPAKPVEQVNEELEAAAVETDGHDAPDLSSILGLN